MNNKTLFDNLSKILNGKVAHTVFKSPQNPPYIIYFQSTDASGGDNEINVFTNTFTVELYDKIRNLELESKIEKMLKENGIAYDVQYGIYINDSKLLLTTYEFETYEKEK